MKAMREIELKLEPGDEGARALRSHPLLKRRKASVTPQTTVYYDTPDGAVRKAGFTLRLRSSGGLTVQTVKQSGDGAAGMFDRPEWEEELKGPGLDFKAVDRTPLGKRLDRAVRRKLEPLVTSTVDRTTWRLTRTGSEIELVLDEGNIAAGGAEQALEELEVELKRGDPRAVFDLAREFGRTVPLRLGVLSKAERGFALAQGALDKATKSEPIAIDRDMNVADAFAAIVHACLRQFRRNEPLVAARRDPNALHQARVAMRRLRSAFSLFGRPVRDEEGERLREELRWFTGQLGDARNLDVLLQRLEDAGLPDDGRMALEAARERAYDTVIAAMDSQRLRDLLLDLVAWVELGDWREGKAAKKPIPEFAAKRIDRRWRKIRKAGREVAELEHEARHRVRIDIKKLRYALEFMTDLFDQAREKPFLSAVEKMQDELGYLNDIATARELLGRIPGLDRGGIPEPTPEEEKEHLARAQRAFAAIVEVGPYWRDAADGDDDGA